MQEVKRTLCARLVPALLICAATAAAQHPVKTLYSFVSQSTDGTAPDSIAIDGRTIYGATVSGGSANAGTVYSLTPPASPGGAWTENQLYSFSPSDGGISPYPTVQAVKGGTIYGITMNGGSAEYGTVFQLTPPASPGGPYTYTDIYEFSGGSDGRIPEALIEHDGILYGVTYNGGNTGCGYGCGVVFTLTPPSSGSTWTENVIYTFQGGSDAAEPVSLTMGGGGVIYGATSSGGGANAGAIFVLRPSSAPGGPWTEHVLYGFAGGSDGSYPLSVAIGAGGVLYGSTFEGGITGGACLTYGCGTIFAVTPPAGPGDPWTKSTLYQFAGNADGMYPFPQLAIDSAGVLYGTTGSTDYQDNSLFSLAPPASPGGDWTKTILHSFKGAHGGGFGPSTGVVSGGGLLYGATVYGGASGGGTIYSFKP